MTNIKELYDREDELYEYDGEDKVVSSKEFESELQKEPPRIKIDSQIPSLDESIESFEVGELIVVSGPTKNGKSSVCHTLTKNFENQGVKSLWFSYEVTPRQLFSKFKVAEEFYLPKKLKTKNMEWIRDRIIEAKAKYQIKTVFIDHLHYLYDMEKSKNSSLEIGTIIRELKQMCVDFDIVIFLMAHMTKTKYDEMPTESDLRDSSFITQEADSTFIVWRERKKSKHSLEYEFTGKTFLIVSNHRRAGTMGKIIKLDFINNEFVEEESEYDKVLREATQ